MVTLEQNKGSYTLSQATQTPGATQRHTTRPENLPCSYIGYLHTIHIYVAHNPQASPGAKKRV
jgi:hypothetical protein